MSSAHVYLRRPKVRGAHLHAFQYIYVHYDMVIVIEGPQIGTVKIKPCCGCNLTIGTIQRAVEQL